MYIIEVIPITKSLRKDSLTYFYGKDIPIGKTVIIPLRNKEVAAIVVTSEAARNSRSALKQKDFVLKKIVSVCKEDIVLPQLVTACEFAANYHASQTGLILQSTIPAAILDPTYTQATLKKVKKSETTQESPERYIIQEPSTERMGTFKQLIRTSFAQKKSIIIVCPTETDCEQTKKAVAKGIDSHTFMLTSSATKKKQIEKWNNCLVHEKPVVIITTPKFFAVPRHDIGTIIVDTESSSSYVSQQRPYVDYRIILEAYAAALDAKYYLADCALRAETLLRFDNHEFVEEGLLQFRTVGVVPTKIVDMKAQSAKTFTQFSEETRTILEQKTKEHLFIYVARKGLAPTVSCQDCGTLVTCNECNAPVVLYSAKKTITEESMFRCNQCGTSRKALEKCSYCDGWRLQMIGVGTESIALEIMKKYPNRTVFIIDREHTKTHAQAKKVRNEFYATEGAVLVGTDMAVNYIHTVIPHIHIASIDALFTLPHYAIREKIMRTILVLQNKATTTFTIQTRIADDSLFKNIKEGMLTEFYRDEFKARKQYEYPPFTTLIRISVAGVLETAKESLATLQSQLITIDPIAENSVQYESPYTKNGKTICHLLLKIDAKKWPKTKLLLMLRSLPPQYKVMINPQQLF